MPVKTVVVDAEQVDGFRIEAKSRDLVSIIDQPVEGGGKNTGPTPLEYLLISLAGCIASVGHIIVRQRRLPIQKIRVRVEGEIDTDVLMGKRADVRAGFSDIRAHVEIDGEISREEKEQFLRDVDARCPISDNILNLSSIKFLVD